MVQLFLKKSSKSGYFPHHHFTKQNIQKQNGGGGNAGDIGSHSLCFWRMSQIETPDVMLENYESYLQDIGPVFKSKMSVD